VLFETFSLVVITSELVLFETFSLASLVVITSELVLFVLSFAVHMRGKKKV
jgi:hypothetical protein